MNNDAHIPIPALWVLRAALALTCLGTAVHVFQYGGPVLSWLWMNEGWSEQAALRVEHAGAWAMLACIPFLFWRAAWFVPKLVSAWLLLTAIASTLIGTWHPELILPAHAARYLAPLALAAFHYSDTPRSRKLGEWLLRTGVGATFIAHGIEALLQKARFLDYLIVGADKLLGVDLSEPAAGWMLVAIGVVDVLVGLAVLLPRRWRVLALWLAFWGFVTAFARIVYMGFENYPETLIRLAHGAVPLTLVFLWTWTTDRHEPTE